MKRRYPVAAIILALALAQPAGARHGDVAAALAGGIVGAAIGAALSDRSTHDTLIYHDGPRPHHRAGRFSPASGVECYDASQACYYRDGSYSGK